jgi:hypothetical protein
MKFCSMAVSRFSINTNDSRPWPTCIPHPGTRRPAAGNHDRQLRGKFETGVLGRAADRVAREKSPQ